MSGLRIFGLWILTATVLFGYQVVGEQLETSLDVSSTTESFLSPQSVRFVLPSEFSPVPDGGVGVLPQRLSQETIRSLSEVSPLSSAVLSFSEQGAIGGPEGGTAADLLTADTFSLPPWPPISAQSPSHLPSQSSPSVVFQLPAPVPSPFTSPFSSPSPFQTPSTTQTSTPPLPVSTRQTLPPLPQSPPLQDTTPESVQQILATTTPLEQAGRWGDALVVYEAEFRSHIIHPALRVRYLNARYHFDVAKRYNDKTFLAMLDSASLADSLDLLRDVGSKILEYHVEAADWDRLFRYGVEDLQIALITPRFLEKNGITIPAHVTSAFAEKVRQTAAMWIIQDWTDMRNGTLKIAEMAQMELGLRPNATMVEFCCAAANSLDPISAFLSMGQLNDTTATIDGNFVGIGVRLDSQGDRIAISQVFSGTPAALSGLRAGDVILAVDGKNVQGKSMDVVAELLQGENGSATQLQVVRTGESPRVVSIRRQPILVPSVEDVKMLTDTVGYAKLVCFQSKTKEQLEAALWHLSRQGMKSMVLDLRQNPGGLFPVSIEVANLFLEEGVIVRTRGKYETPYFATRPGTWRMPLVVLLDEESASAAEVFAGALQDNNRALIVGNRSYGKGTVQAIFKLFAGVGGPAAGLRLTTERFYSPKGHPYNGVGITPDHRPDVTVSVKTVPTTNTGIESDMNTVATSPTNVAVLPSPILPPSLPPLIVDDVVSVSDSAVTAPTYTATNPNPAPTPNTTLNPNTGISSAMKSPVSMPDRPPLPPTRQPSVPQASSTSQLHTAAKPVLDTPRLPAATVPSSPSAMSSEISTTRNSPRVAAETMTDPFIRKALAVMAL